MNMAKKEESNGVVTDASIKAMMMVLAMAGISIAIELLRSGEYLFALISAVIGIGCAVAKYIIFGLPK